MTIAEVIAFARRIAVEVGSWRAEHYLRAYGFTRTRIKQILWDL